MSSNVGYKANDMEEAILTTLTECNLDLQDYRGQSYLTTTNMSGFYAGLQARIKNLNNLVIYCRCATHKLNCAEVNTVESVSKASSFFDYLEDMNNLLPRRLIAGTYF